MFLLSVGVALVCVVVGSSLLFLSYLLWDLCSLHIVCCVILCCFLFCVDVFCFKHLEWRIIGIGSQSAKYTPKDKTHALMSIYVCAIVCDI